MAHNLNGYYFAQINFTASNDSWTVGMNAVISSSSYGLFGDIGYDTIAITVKGRIWGADAAIHAAGDNIKAVIEPTGRLSGEYGIFLDGAHGSVRNAGEITSTYGVQASGEDIKISNTGFINAANTGINMSHASDTFTNGKTGEIHAGAVGVYMSDPAGGAASRTTNHGLIAGDDFSFFSSNANDKLINDGKMIGTVFMGAGNDTLDTRGGTIQGLIYLGSGDDRLYTDKASHKLIETSDGGSDTVYSTVSYKLSDYVEVLYLIGKKDINATGTAGGDYLHGNSGDNIVRGLDGSDVLSGHKGNDKLYGGFDADVFRFATGDGKDVIMDFENGIDVIDVTGWNAIASFSDLKNNHATNQGNDLLLHAGSDSLLIKNFQKADLDPADVYFGI
jgi:Ca2+-binding RTX toxin-like protein